jgi:hypothetical protein
VCERSVDDIEEVDDVEEVSAWVCVSASVIPFEIFAILTVLIFTPVLVLPTTVLLVIIPTVLSLLPTLLVLLLRASDNDTELVCDTLDSQELFFDSSECVVYK